MRKGTVYKNGKDEEYAQQNDNNFCQCCIR